MEYADQRAHDVAWMTSAEREDYESRIRLIDNILYGRTDFVTTRNMREGND